MKEWTINFVNGREPLIIEGDNFAAAVEAYLKESKDLSFAIFIGVNLIGANLNKADLSYAILSFTDLINANLTCTKLIGTKLDNANLRNANLKYADLTGADLIGTDLTCTNLSYARLVGANLDHSCLPLWCGSLNIEIDKKIACQFLYHTLRAMQSVDDDDEIKAILNDPKVLASANQFHRVDECGKIEKEKENGKLDNYI